MISVSIFVIIQELTSSDRRAGKGSTAYRSFSREAKPLFTENHIPPPAYLGKVVAHSKTVKVDDVVTPDRAGAGMVIVGLPAVDDKAFAGFEGVAFALVFQGTFAVKGKGHKVGRHAGSPGVMSGGKMR
jgi:hypothetical protein